MLMGLDSKQLNTMTYVGFNYASVGEAEEHITNIGFRQKVKDCQLFSFDQLKYVKVNADFGFMVDVLHHLDPFDLSILLPPALHYIKQKGVFYIFEETKIREACFPWSAEDISKLFSDQKIFEVYTTELSVKKEGESSLRCSATLNKKFSGTLGEDFVDICFYAYEDRLELIKEEIAALSQKIKTKELSKEKRAYLSKLIYLSSTIETQLRNAKKKLIR